MGLQDSFILYTLSCVNLVSVEKRSMAQIPIFLPIFIAILIGYIYVIVSAFFVHRKCNYVHQTAVSILIGVVIGIVVALRTQIFDNATYSFYTRDVIILILLPLMLFEDGYNIRKRKFFQNILYINLYGIIGTIINFFAIFWILYAFNNSNLFTFVNNSPLKLQTWQLMAMAACLCSIDTIVAQKIVNPERYPKLFSIIFGQSIMKDAITITLFDAIINYSTKMASNAKSDPQFNATEFGFLALTFFQVFVASVLIGVACALVNTFLFKNMRFLLDEKGVSEVAMILLIGYSSYILSEWAAYSGVISMLFCGITLSHFNIYNLTTEGRISAKVAVSALAKIAQGVLFLILGGVIIGLQIQQQDTDNPDDPPKVWFSWNLLLATILSVLVGRFANIFLVTLASYFVVGKKNWRLNFYEYQILFFSGLVKGAVPFAIITTMPALPLADPTPTAVQVTGCIKNNIVIIVFVTSLFLNSILPKILRSRVAKIDEMIKNHEDHPSLYDSLLVQIRKKQAQQQQVNRQTKFDSLESRKDSEVNSRLQTQKEELQKLALLAKIKSTTQKYWKRCEQGFLKPFLIYDYHNRRQQIKQEKIRQRKEEVQQFWKRYKAGEGLNPENEQLNKFIDVKLVESDQYSEDEAEKERMIEEQNGELIFYTKNNKSPSKIQKQVDGYELKNIKSNTDSINPIIQNLDQIVDIKDKRREYKSLRLQEKDQKKQQKKDEKKQVNIAQKNEKPQSKQKEQVQETKIDQQNKGDEIKSV